jgi:hypothetical protein
MPTLYEALSQSVRDAKEKIPVVLHRKNRQPWVPVLLGCSRDPEPVADRYHCTYFMICLLMELKVDFVVRLHRQRTADFRRGRRLGQGDHVVAWKRPRRPDWMDEATYQRMPETIEIREVVVQVKRPGLRVDAFVVVTTLLDAEEYTQEDVAELYHKRWLVETFFRFFKHMLGCRHLLSHNKNGIEIQTYCAIIACLLIALWTGRKPTLRTYEMICFYFCGLASEEELLSHIAKLKQQDAANSDQR